MIPLNVNGVVHQLLDRRRRPFNHFPRRDPVDRRIIKLPDYRHFLAYVGVIHRHKTKSSMVPLDSATVIARRSGLLPGLLLYSQYPLRQYLIKFFAPPESHPATKGEAP